MSIFKNKSLKFLAFIVFPLFVLGCSGNKAKVSNAAEEIKLNSGAVLKSEDSSYGLYNYKDGKYEKEQINGMVVTYDKSSSSYIYMQDEKHYIVHNGYKMEIKDKNYSNIKMSPNGEYVSYFIENDGLKLKVVTNTKDKEIQLKSNVSISGTLYDWYDKNTLVYYGISNDGVNGIFTYNLETNKEDLLYKIQEGFLSFIKASKDNVVFLQIDLENKKSLMMINKGSKEVTLLNDNIEIVSDVVIQNDELYFTGKISSDKESLYKINGDKVKRVVFDFPNVVKIDKGLCIDENNNILFIGSNASLNNESIYSFSEDGTIELLSKPAKEYIFLDYIS
ncbi:hypothetical protein UT300005_03150 [Clostridium sp. CTA-5]